MELIYPEKEYRNSVEYIIYEKPYLFTPFIPIYYVAFVFSVGAMISYILFILYRAYRNIFLGHAFPYSGMMGSFLFFVLFMGVLLFIMFISFNIITLYHNDIVKVAVHDKCFVFSKGLSEKTIMISEVEEVTLEENLKNSYYGKYHEVKVHMIGRGYYNFIFTIQMSWAFLPLKIDVPKKNKAFKRFSRKLLALGLIESTS